MESQRVQCCRRNGFISHGLAVFLGNQAGPQIAGNVREILDIRRISSAGCHFRIDKAAEDAGQQPYGSAGHANVFGIFKSQLCQGRTDSSCRAMTTGKSRCQQEPEGIVNIGK